MNEPIGRGTTADNTSGQPVSLGEIARVFLKIGAMSYGGPAIMGIMQAEIQEKRNWIDKKAFVDGLAIVNMLPGPGATQLGIFIGHAKAGIAGGVIAGLCFILPAFLIMLALAAAYLAYGTLPLAAFIGFKLYGISGAAICAAAIFLPSFLMMLTILPILRRMGDLAWLKAFMRGVGPAVIGALAVSLARMAPHAAPDWVTWLLMAATIVALVWKNVGPMPAMLSGAAIGAFLKEGMTGRIRDLMR